ncbi:hypothetical protein MOSE0_D04632 [Monosporozyma servazzii]
MGGFAVCGQPAAELLGNSSGTPRSRAENIGTCPPRVTPPPPPPPPLTATQFSSGSTTHSHQTKVRHQESIVHSPKVHPFFHPFNCILATRAI